jgi:hypothetical protein
MSGCNFDDNYVDNTIGHSTTWTEYMIMMRKLFRRLAKAELKINHEVLYNIGCTGHMVRNGIVQIEDEKRIIIKEQDLPKTKYKSEHSWNSPDPSFWRLRHH